MTTGHLVQKLVNGTQTQKLFIYSLYIVLVYIALLYVKIQTNTRKCGKC